MNILAIDTSTKKANVCLKIDNLFIDRTIDNEITHSEKLLPLINDTLNQNNVTLNDINYLACCTGPGSFTGIRIGIATIKAFAKILSSPIFAVSSLDVIAYTNTNSNYVLSIIDAKNNRIYYSLYRVEKIEYNDEEIPVLKRILDYSNDTIDIALIKITEKISKNNISNNDTLNITGDCILQYKDLFINKLCNCFKQIDIFNSSICSKTLLQLVNNYLKVNINNEFEKNYLTLDAVYVRPSQAERAKNNEL